jgi:hypothetical protein
MSYYSVDEISINNQSHTLFNRPNLISHAEIDNWEYSIHGYLVDLPAGSLELITHDDEGQPAAAIFELGQGCVLATLQTLEWGWDHEYSRLLENYIRYDDCGVNFQLFFSLALNNGP